MELNKTYKGTLPCGLPIEVMRMKGYHQEWLYELMSKGKQKTANSKINQIEDIVADRIYSIGGINFEGLKNEEKKEYVRALPSGEYKYALMLIRFFTCDIHFEERMSLHAQLKDKIEEGMTELEFNKHNEAIREKLSKLPEHIFRYTYEWESTNEAGQAVMKKEELEVPIELTDFRIKKGVLTDIENFNDIQSHLKNKLVLPLSQDEVEWTIATAGYEEKVNANSDEQGISLKRILSLRNVNRLNPKSDGNGFVPIRYDSNKAEYLDNEAIRKDISDKETTIDTTITMIHPETKEPLRINLMSSAAFFFPSGVL